MDVPLITTQTLDQLLQIEDKPKKIYPVKSICASYA